MQLWHQRHKALVQNTVLLTNNVLRQWIISLKVTCNLTLQEPAIYSRTGSSPLIQLWRLLLCDHFKNIISFKVLKTYRDHSFLACLYKIKWWWISISGYFFYLFGMKICAYKKKLFSLVVWHRHHNSSFLFFQLFKQMVSFPRLTYFCGFFFFSFTLN